MLVISKDQITKGPRRHRWWWGRRSLRQLSFRFQCSAAGELKFQFLTSLSSMSWFEVTCCQQCHKSPNHWTAFIVICDSSKVAWIFWHITFQLITLRKKKDWSHLDSEHLKNCKTHRMWTCSEQSNWSPKEKRMITFEIGTFH